MVIVMEPALNPDGLDLFSLTGSICIAAAIPQPIRMICEARIRRWGLPVRGVMIPGRAVRTELLTGST